MIKKPSGPSQRPLTPQDMEELKKSREKLTGGSRPKPIPTPVKPGRDKPKPVPTPVKPGKGRPTPVRPGKPVPTPGTPVLYSGSGMKRGGTVKGKK